MDALIRCGFIDLKSGKKKLKLDEDKLVMDMPRLQLPPMPENWVLLDVMSHGYMLIAQLIPSNLFWSSMFLDLQSSQ